MINKVAVADVGDGVSDYWYQSGDGASEVKVGELARQNLVDGNLVVTFPARVTFDGVFTFNPALKVDFAANLEALAVRRLEPRDASTGFLEAYPVTTRDSADNEYIVGYYIAGGGTSWTFAPLAGGVDKSWDLWVPLNIDGEIERYPLGRIAESVRSTDFGTAFASELADLSPAFNLLAAEDAETAVGARRQDFVAALTALNPLDDATPDTAALTNFWTDYQTAITPATMPAPATETVAPDTPAPATVTDAPGPTTSTMAPTTANATIAPTTTVGSATMAPTTTLVSTTMAGTTLVSTTLVSPTIAGELSVRGAINAQGNIGGNVARSLSGRLSSFRSRNRNKTGQGN